MSVTQCCCCVPLRTGAMVTAITYIVTNCLVLLGWTAFLIERAISLRWDYWVDVLYIFLGLLAVCCPNIAVGSLLVHGLRRNRRKLMFPWIVWNGILKTLLTLAWLGAGVWSLWLLFMSERDNYYGMLIFLAAVIWTSGLVGLSVMWYWYACVMAYYQVLAPSDTYVMATF